MKRTGLLVDWGGVLTTSVFDSFEAFCRAEGLPPQRVVELFRTDPRARELLVGLELGTLPEVEFERGFAALLPARPGDLIARLLAEVRPDTAMLAGVARAREQGVPTGLISNSWGVGLYRPGQLAELFDAVVISGEVGVRKPAPEIYQLGTRALGRSASECVFIDDLAGNLKPAAALGMATIWHQDAASSLAELARLLGVDLRG